MKKDVRFGERVIVDELFDELIEGIQHRHHDLSLKMQLQDIRQRKR